MTSFNNDSGVTIIAAIFIIVVLGFMGVMFLSMVNTGSFTAVNDIQSAQALYVAEGGTEYAQFRLAQNLDWYRSVSDPMPAPASTTLNLGMGSFTVVANLPATKLRRRLQAGDPTVQVYTTDRFPAAGYLQIDDDVATGAEFVQYAGKTATTFTGLIRGVDLGAVATTMNLGAFSRGTAIYPVAQLTAAIANSCAGPSTITIKVPDISAIKFLQAGTIVILTEEIGYTDYSVAGLNITLTGIQRCLAGAGTGVAANANDPVTPLLYGSVTADVESEVISTGTVASASRVERKTVQR